MAKVQEISDITPTLCFTEFDIMKSYRQSFSNSELSRLLGLFPFSAIARQLNLKDSVLGHKSHFSPKGKIALMVLKSYTSFSDFDLVEHLNGNIHYQLFCGIQVNPSDPLTNHKIVSTPSVRNWRESWTSKPCRRHLPGNGNLTLITFTCA